MSLGSEETKSLSEMLNCRLRQLEFNHAVRVLKTSNILPIVMDSSMSKTSDWKGAIGFHLGNKLYVNMTGNVNDPTYLEDKVCYHELLPC